MKMKRKVRIFLIVLICLLILGVGGFFFYKSMKKPKPVEEVKVINKIDKYNYSLKENKPSKYKEMFKELEKILNSEEVNEEEYAKKISEMFIFDFFSLNDKTAKTDVGGLDFVYKPIIENVIQNAQDTYYKYVESNIYNNRKQSLPVVSDVTIESIETLQFTFGDKKDDKAYRVKATWSYTDDQFSSYQKTGTLILVHDENKLSIVELQK